MIYGISKYGGNSLHQDAFPKYRKDLEEMFQIVKRKELKDIKGLEVLNGMLRVIRKHRMKLDGEFATLLTNMLALEGIAKRLDPEINIMRCAVPYLRYKYVTIV
jgi:predicted unusual protein kinase regulating ubiquinone biosynthesis (AarF/ABC1/UbiB family)